MSSLIPQALFLIYNRPLKIFVEHLFNGNISIRSEDLSEEQLPIYNLPINRNYIVKGGPGTGKTIMAYFRANRIAKEVVVKTWHQWLWGKIKYDLGKDPDDYQYEPYDYKWDLVTKLFEEEIYPNIDNSCHLFLDEAQDFPKELAAILSKCFKAVTIFIDEHQAIDRTTTRHFEMRQIFGIESNPFPLSKNYRNIPEIYKVARLFFTGDFGELPEECHIKSTGEKPRIILDYSFQDTIDFLTNYAYDFPHKMVGVVLPSPEIRSNYYNALSKTLLKDNVQEYESKKKYESKKMNNFNFSVPGLKLLTLNTVKGLEFDTVFICDVDDRIYGNIIKENEKGKLFFNRLYVACSRAKTDLLFTCKNHKENTFILEILNKNSELLDYTNAKVNDESVLDDVPF